MQIPPPSNTDGPHYGQRDTLTQGNYFMRHMLAMTGEGLHAKSAIAAELAHRDMEIDRLRKEAERYQFLRDDFSPMGLNIDGNHAWAYRRNATLKGPNLDAAIDAAMAPRPVLGAA